eukprot:CAMPEP_0179146426 /NCGR_PEP_ID=MMETSP0796-20121207/70702_1 /TAXON_ID=73915 /ORGANISM="Pyrodinium bahamense, Strain pbaha01" /LENGTH=31 /DNA_ID= /DNA_START= /DNA_END= /DNA_ORIENTATION=
MAWFPRPAACRAKAAVPRPGAAGPQRPVKLT